MASSGIRALRGCRALLAPAKSSASSSAAAAEVIKTTTSKQPKPKATTAKPKPTKTAKATPSTSTTVPKRASGIQKVSPISPQLQTFLGAPEASRSDAVKQIWSYIKLHNLQNPADKREIYCDEKLKGLFDGKEKVGFLEIGKLLFRHFIKTE